MENIEYNKIISEIKANIQNSETNNIYGNFDNIRLSPAQINGYKINFDNLKNGTGLKKLINKIVLKFTRNHLLQIIQMQNEINDELIKRIELQNSKIEYLETLIKGN